MLKKYILPTLILLFLIPSFVMAVDFTIPDVKIDAYLQENGDVNVSERHTYTFDGKYNGITREIFPKKGAEIKNFLAKEGEKGLKVEKEGELYKIHRKGNDDTIQVDIYYTIKNGMDKYTDVAEFYWPFFDDRNESEYGRMTVSIHPPQPADEAIALGYDSAFKTDSVIGKGTAVFSMGEVEAGENGDVRVAYNSSLFPAMALTADKAMKEEIINEKTTMEKNAIIYAKNKKKTAAFGTWSLIGFTVLFIGIIVYERNGAKRKKQRVNDETFKQNVNIPEQELSMPATIYFTDKIYNETIAAALMDLVRQGYVRQTAEGQFVLINKDAKKEHEKILVNLLFDKIGWDGAFSMGDLEEFMEDKKNHLKYNGEITRWKAAVVKETRHHGLYSKRKGVRAAAGLLSVFPFLFIIVSVKYNLFLYMTLSIFLLIAHLSFIIFYKSLTEKGIRIRGEWKRLGDEFNQMSDEEWNRYSEDDRMRAMIYSLGISGTMHTDTNKYTPAFVQADEGGNASGLYPMYWPSLASSFETAGEQAYETSSSQSSSSSSSGGGVGGGGGGSGAF